MAPRSVRPRSSSESTSSASDTNAAQRTRRDLHPQPQHRPSPAETAAKKRKATYYHRKARGVLEEIDILKAELLSLRDQLQEVEKAAVVGRSDSLTAMDAAGRSTFYEKNIERNNLKLAGTQAMLSAYNMTVGTTSATIPLSSYVHLPVDATARTDMMRSMHLDKLRVTYQFMGERLRGLDLSVTQAQHEQFNFPNGDIVFSGFDVTHFDTGHSLRQVFDAFMFFMGNQEISMSTELGLLTIRESEDVGDSLFMQTRFLSVLPEGLEIESNAVMFAACVDATDTKPGYAVGCIDFVDEDDLHPYRPDQCSRRDMTAAVQFTELPSVDGSGPPVIVVSRWAHVRFRPPTTPLSKELEAATRARIGQNDEIAFKVMRERLATVEPAGSVVAGTATRGDAMNAACDA